MTNECRLAARLIAERKLTESAIRAAANRLHCGTQMAPLGRFHLNAADGGIVETIAFVCLTCRTMHYEAPVVSSTEIPTPPSHEG